MLLLSVLCSAATTHAYEFQSGDLYYNITSDNTVEVTYQEHWSKSNYQGLTTATIPETVTYYGTTYSVTSIGNEAFYGCSSLTKTNYTGDLASWCAISFSTNYSNPTFYSHNLYINDVEVKD